MTHVDVARVLREARIRWSNERKMQFDVALALNQHGIRFEREKRLDRANRIDFLAEESIGIECKVKGTILEAAEQLKRYAAFPQIESFILVTCRSAHRVPATSVSGKPLLIVWVAGKL